MKTLFESIIILGLTGLLFTSCRKNTCMEGHGTVVTKELSISKFNGFRSSGSLNVEVVQGESQRVIALGHSNIIEMIEKDVHGGIWDIDLRDGCYRDYQLSIIITMPEVKEIYMSGSGKVSLGDFDQESELIIGLEGSGQLQGRTLSGVKSLTNEIVGSGYIEFSGLSNDLEFLAVTIEGSGKFKGFDLGSKYAYCSIGGSGVIQLSVSDNLEAHINGSGIISYKGHPVIQSHIRGSGELVNAN